jgi:hypothetical protein
MPGGIMKLVAEYLVDAIKFDRMAEDATDVALKVSFRKQAASTQKSQAAWHAAARRFARAENRRDLKQYVR